MIQFLLSLFKPFRWLIEKMGADYNQFIRILELKLTMDNRRTRSLANNVKNVTESSLIKQAFAQMVLGIMFGTFLIIIKSEFTYYYFAHWFIMMMMAMMIVSEFTTILFDTSENMIIQPLPIKGNTVSLARNTHVLLYLSMTAFNLSVVSIIIAGFKFGILSALLFVFTILLNALFTLFLANLLYLGIMRLATGEKLKNLLMYFQIFIAIFFMMSYQFGLNLVDRSVIGNMTLNINWYTFLVPAAFFSGFIETLSSAIFNWEHLIFVAEALILPPLAVFMTGKYLTPIFNRKLLSLEQGDKATKVKESSMHQGIWYRIMLAVFVHKDVEKVSFRLGWQMTGSERLFKQSFFPSIGYILIMIVLPFFKESFNLNELAQSSRHLFILYAFIIVAATIPTALLVGNNQHAGWVYRTLPVSSPVCYFKGFIKAAFARFFIPLFAIVSVALCFVWGVKILPDIIVALLAIYLTTCLFYYLQTPSFPFGQEKMANQGGSNIVKVLAIMLLAAIAGITHYFVTKWFSYGSIALIPIYLGAIYYVNRVQVYRIITWETVDKANSYS